jgi:hypothetical protein
LVFTLAAASLRPAPSGCPRRMTAICAKETAGVDVEQA